MFHLPNCQIYAFIRITHVRFRRQLSLQNYLAILLCHRLAGAIGYIEPWFFNSLSMNSCGTFSPDIFCLSLKVMSLIFLSLCKRSNADISHFTVFCWFWEYKNLKCYTQLSNTLKNCVDQWATWPKFFHRSSLNGSWSGQTRILT